MEWSAQWVLSEHADVKTERVPVSIIPDVMDIIHADRMETAKLSLVQAWELASHICDELTYQFWLCNKEKIKELLSIRNNSLLAHGYAPITHNQWEDISVFIEDILIPYLLLQFSKFKISELPVQLPTTWVEQPD